MTTKPKTRAEGRRLVLGELARRRGPLLNVLLWTLVEGVPSLLSGALVARALDGGFLSGRAAAGFGWLAVLGAAMLVRAFAQRAGLPALADVVEPMRDRLVTRVVEGTIGRAAAGQQVNAAAVSQVTEQVETVRRLVSALLRTVRQTAATLALTLIGLAVLAPALLVPVLVPLLISLLLFAALLRPLTERQRTAMLAEESVTVAAGTVLRAVPDIASLGAEDRAVEDFETEARRQARASVALARWSALRTSIVLIGGQFPLLAVLVLGPGLVASGRLTVGALVGATTYIATGLLPGLQVIVSTFGTWGVQLGVVADRLAEVAAPPTHPVAPSRPAHQRNTAAATEPVCNSMVLDAVTFGYGGRADPVLRDLDLTIAAGEHIALIGPSGVGKSTLASLLTGLLPPTAGTVRMGGVPLEHVPLDQRHRAVALIPQEAYVFAGTVAENLRYQCQDAPEAQLLAAASAVGLDAALSRWGGLDAVLDEDGTGLSAGERQLIALARVYLCDASVVILDEATCHLDPHAEARAEAAFAALPGTLVVIAHRLASARRAHRIILLDGDRVVSGDEAELLDRSALFRDMIGHWETPAEAPPEQVLNS